METGIVVGPGNPRALKKAMEMLIQNRELREKLGKNALSFVLNNCTREMAARTHYEVFRKILTGKVK